MVLNILIESAGIALLLFTLRDVFHDLFHPTRSGSLSDLIGHVFSRLLRHTRFRPSIGALPLISVILCWVAVIVLSFALIYFPLIPQDITGAGPSPSLWERTLRSLYFSLGSLDTFTNFDLRPESAWLRLLVAVEGVIGISMITASVSWLVLLYPALERNRFLARRVFILVKAQQASGISRIENDQLITDLADRVVQARIDLILFPILLNFHSSEASQSLASALPLLQQVARCTSFREASPSLKLAAAELTEALQEFSQMLAGHVLEHGESDVDQIFQAYLAHES